MEIDIHNKIKRYCSGKLILNALQEKDFLADINLHAYTGVNLSKNSGKISEWYVCQLLKEKCIDFLEQPNIKYGVKERYFKPDIYIPSKNMFIEVKSRTYNCGGTSSEKIDNVARKYSTKLSLTKDYKDAKILIVFCAGELYEESTLQLINYKHNNTPIYVKEFIELSKRHNVLDWIDINNIDRYL